jgi:DNA-binding HxlR family transcriptional regulator
MEVIENKNGKRNFKDIPKSSSTIISKRLKDLLEFNIIAREESGKGIKKQLTPLGERVRKSILPRLKIMEQEALDAFRLSR